jgi:hypothetical protein
VHRAGWSRARQSFVKVWSERKWCRRQSSARGRNAARHENGQFQSRRDSIPRPFKIMFWRTKSYIGMSLSAMIEISD